LRNLPSARSLAAAFAMLPALAWGAVPAPTESAGPPTPVSRPSAERVRAHGNGAYHTLLGNLSINAPQDTLGGAQYEAARSLFEAGLFDSAAAEFGRFAARFPRNLFLNDALEHVLLIRENREPGDEALRLYAHAVALHGAGLSDSAASVAETGLSRFPKARIRYHWQYLLAEISRERGDHVGAIRYALVIADSTSKSRLAPYALKLAGDESIAMGDDPAKALRLYQALLERYPASPLAPPVRAQVLEMRKKLQL
jgi:TolA-binding protein